MQTHFFGHPGQQTQNHKQTERQTRRTTITYMYTCMYTITEGYPVHKIHMSPYQPSRMINCSIDLHYHAPFHFTILATVLLEYFAGANEPNQQKI